MVCAMLTLALDDSTETADPKLHTVMFNIYSLEKAERFCTVVQDVTPK